jgi:hypothetical protein
VLRARCNPERLLVAHYGEVAWGENIEEGILGSCA